MGAEKSADDSVQGTTLKVYRFIYMQGHPVGVREIQERLGMASPSTAHYHIQKLLEGGLVREEGSGYVVDRVFLENFVKIGGTAIPLQAPLAAFFVTCLVILVIVVRPGILTSGYLLGVAVTVVALAVAVFQSIRDLRQRV